MYTWPVNAFFELQLPFFWTFGRESSVPSNSGKKLQFHIVLAVPKLLEYAQELQVFQFFTHHNWLLLDFVSPVFLVYASMETTIFLNHWKSQGFVYLDIFLSGPSSCRIEKWGISELVGFMW